MKQAFSRRKVLSVGTRALAGAALGNTIAPLAFAQTAQTAPAQITRTFLEYASVLHGAGGNVFLVPGMDDKGCLLVDGGLSANTDALLATVQTLTGQDKVHTLINTHFHPEQTGSNERIGAAGGIIIAHENTQMCLRNSLLSASYEGRYGPLADVGIPSQTIRGDGTLKFAGQEIIYSYLPAAHTNGDIFLYFPILDTLVCGGPVTTDRWPVLDWCQGGWIGGLVRAYDELAAVVSADTTVVPAHGPVVNGQAIVRMRNMYSELHLILAEQLNIGMGWDDIVKLNPLRQYEDQYGDASAFLEAAHRSMQLAYLPD